jgi:hypothetical protein
MTVPFVTGWTEQGSVMAPIKYAEVVVPSATVNYVGPIITNPGGVASPAVARGLLLQDAAAAVAAVVFPDGSVCLMTLSPGIIHPIMHIRINIVGTTSTSMVAVF